MPQLNAVLAVVMVWLAVLLKVMVPVDVHVVPLVSARLPLIASVGVVPVANVQPVTLTVMLRHSSAPVMVTVPGVPDPLSKNTLSAAVGTVPVPPVPPLELAQLVVDEMFQVPAPPTQ